MHPNVEARFHAKYEMRGPNECWLWQAAKQSKGYGQMWADGLHVLAHRLAYEIAQGPIPDGLYVLHRCDNPPCVNPAHLWVGTPSENMWDKSRKGRHHSSAKTHCPSGHPYDEENTYVNRQGYRWCRACNRIRSRKRRASELPTK